MSSARCVDFITCYCFFWVRMLKLVDGRSRSTLLLEDPPLAHIHEGRLDTGSADIGPVSPHDGGACITACPSHLPTPLIHTDAHPKVVSSAWSFELIQPFLLRADRVLIGPPYGLRLWRGCRKVLVRTILKTLVSHIAST